MDVDVPAVFEAYEAFLVHELDELERYRATARVVGFFVDFVTSVAVATEVMGRRGGGRPPREPSGTTSSGRFRPGQYVPVSGIWSSLEGREACLSQGDRFPPSPSSWGPVRLVRSPRRRPRSKD